MFQLTKDKFTYGNLIIVYSVVHMCLIYLFHLMGMPFFKTISNGLALVFVVFLGLLFFVNFMQHKIPRWCAHVFFIVHILLLMNFITAPAYDLPVIVKYYAIIVLGIFTLSSPTPLPNIPGKYLAFMIILPLTIIPLGGSKVYQFLGSTVDIGLFPNANTAVMYYVVMIALASIKYKSPIMTYASLIFNSMIFQKLGAMLATLVAISLTNINVWIRHIVVIAILGSAAAFGLFQSGALDRLIEVLTVLGDLVMSEDGLQIIVKASYGDLVALTGSTDLSAIFRIKQWTEMMDLFLRQEFWGILFGYGTGVTKTELTAKLLPHNDYMRVLCELGVLNFILFNFYNYMLFKRIKLIGYKTAFLVIVFYFMTENLIDNFISMLLLYTFAGYMARDIIEPQADEHEAHDMDDEQYDDMANEQNNKAIASKA